LSLEVLHGMVEAPAKLQPPEAHTQAANRVAS
jgi:hypothetical protein